MGEYGGEKLQGGRKEAVRRRKKGADTHIKRLGSIMHGDFLDGRVTRKFPIWYYTKHALVWSMINSKGHAGSTQEQTVNVKEVEYEMYFCPRTLAQRGW